MHTGSSRSAAYLARELNEIGFDVTVLVPRGKRSLQLLDRLGVKYQIARYYNWTKKIDESWYMKLARLIRQKARFFYNRTLGYREIKKVINEGGYDLVALNNTWVYLPALAAQNLGIPFVWHLREFNEEDHGWTFCDKPKSWSLMERSSALIGVSEAILEKYKSSMPLGRYHKVFNGIDPAEFISISRIPLADECVKYGMIGRISPGKGQVDFISALHKVRKEHPYFTASIAGTGTKADESALENCIDELGMNDRVQMLGNIDDLARFYSSIDILVVCSKMEAFGRVAVEGLLAGCVVVCSDTGGLREIIRDGETGFVFNHEDNKALSTLLERIVDMPQIAQQVARRGRQSAFESFTASANARNIASVYQGVLENREIVDAV